MGARILNVSKGIIESNQDRLDHERWYKRKFDVGEPISYDFLVDLKDSDSFVEYRTATDTDYRCLARINMSNTTNTPRIYIDQFLNHNNEVIRGYDYGLDYNKASDVIHPLISDYILENKTKFEPAVVKYAQTVSDYYERFNMLYKESVKEGKDGFDFRLDANNSVYISASTGYSDDKVEYWFIHHPDLCGSESLWDTLDTLVNAVESFREADKSRNDIVDFYVREILPVDFIRPLPDELAKIYDDSCFSDWHKDCFGHRPYGDANNECLQIFLSEGGYAKDYVDYVKSWNEKGKPCPVSFEDYKTEQKERALELENEEEFERD